MQANWRKKNQIHLISLALFDQNTIPRSMALVKP